MYDQLAQLANEASKAKFGESIYASGLRDWAKHKELDGPPPSWPRGFACVSDDRLSWQPFDWHGNSIGEPWQFKCDIADDADLVFNVWGDVYDDRVYLDFCDDDPDQKIATLKEYFENMGWVLDATVDPQRYGAILMRLPRQRPPRGRRRPVLRP
jgi:hypothetical protein